MPPYPFADLVKTVLLAMQLGQPAAIRPEEARKWYDRYHQHYGQRAPGA
jgi:hypothetical protein